MDMGILDQKEAGGTMKIDVSGTLKKIPNMSEQALARLKTNVDAWKASGDPNKLAAAERVAAAIERAQAVVSRIDYDDLSQDQRVERLRQAFTRRPLTETEAKVLTVLLRYPGETSRALSRRLDWEGQTWHAHFGKMCHAREDLLWSAPPSKVRDDAFFSGMLADFDKADRSWRIKPELEDALFDIAGLAKGSKAAAK